MITDRIHASSDNPSKINILQTAYRLFGERSIADVSVRELAKEAGVNIASIHYYYGSKEALYLVVVENITEMMAEQYRSFSEAYKKAADTTPADDAFHIQWIKRLVEIIAHAMLFRLKENNYLHRILIREQMTPSNGFTLLYENALAPMLEQLDTLIASITHQSADSVAVRARSHALIGQIAIFGVQQHTVSRRIAFLDATHEQNMETIIKIILENCEFILQGLIAQREIS